jgi:hypothetical protein
VIASQERPTVIDSHLVQLADPDVKDSRQPYHASFGTAQTDTAEVTRLVRGIERFSRRSVAALLGDYRDRHRLRGAGVVVASLTDPVSIANRHMRAHASEGRLFRSVLVAALEQCGVSVRIVLEREVYELLGKALRRSPTEAKSKSRPR